MLSLVLRVGNGGSINTTDNRLALRLNVAIIITFQLIFVSFLFLLIVIAAYGYRFDKNDDDHHEQIMTLYGNFFCEYKFNIPEEELFVRIYP